MWGFPEMLGFPKDHGVFLLKSDQHFGVFRLGGKPTIFSETTPWWLRPWPQVALHGIFQAHQLRSIYRRFQGFLCGVRSGDGFFPLVLAVGWVFGKGMGYVDTCIF